MILAARFYSVPPWELLNREVGWIRMALAAMEAEAHAEQQRSKHLNRRQR